MNNVREEISVKELGDVIVGFIAPDEANIDDQDISDLLKKGKITAEEESIMRKSQSTVSNLEKKWTSGSASGASTSKKIQTTDKIKTEPVKTEKIVQKNDREDRERD